MVAATAIVAGDVWRRGSGSRGARGPVGSEAARAAKGGVTPAHVGERRAASRDGTDGRAGRLPAGLRLCRDLAPAPLYCGFVCVVCRAHEYVFLEPCPWHDAMIRDVTDGGVSDMCSPASGSAVGA